MFFFYRYRHTFWNSIIGRTIERYEKLLDQMKREEK